MFKEELLTVKSDLTQLKTNDRNDIIKLYISQRLNESLKAYYADLSESVKHLEYNKKVITKL